MRGKKSGRRHKIRKNDQEKKKEEGRVPGKRKE